MPSGMLSHTVMTALVREIVPATSLGSVHFRGPLPAVTDSYTWDVIQGSIEAPKHRDPRGEAGNKALMPKKKITTPIPTFREKKAISGADLEWLRKPGTEHEKYGQTMLVDELGDLVNILQLGKEKLRWDLLVDGKVTITMDYDVGGSDQTFELSFVDATWTTNHNPSVKDGASTDWIDDTDVDVMGQISGWKERVERDSGKALKRAWCTSDVMDGLMQQAQLTGLFSNEVKHQVIREGFTQRLLGLDWTVYDAGYEWGGTFYKYLEGSTTGDRYVVFTTGDPVGEERACVAPDDEAQQIGLFSKMYPTDDPAAKFVLVHETSMAGLTKPNELLSVKVS